MAGELPRITEEEFIKQVAELANLYGWVCAHFRPARTHHGFRTACQFQAKGFPDLLMTHAARHLLVVAELKVGGNKCTAEQREWIYQFTSCNVATFVWTPDDWGDIESLLKGETPCPAT